MPILLPLDVDTGTNSGETDFTGRFPKSGFPRKLMVFKTIHNIFRHKNTNTELFELSVLPIGRMGYRRRIAASDGCYGRSLVFF